MGAPIFQLDKAKTALLIIDMQNDFLKVGAPLEVPTGRDIIPNIKKLRHVCRELKIPIIYTVFETSPDTKGLMWLFHSEHAPPTKACWEGSEGADIYFELYPQENERVIRKHGYDAFYDTDLDTVLRSMGIEYLIITGVMTNFCVDSTIRGAFHRQYKIIVVSDGVACPWPDVQAAELKTFALGFARVLKTEEVINELKYKTKNDNSAKANQNIW
jgi:ureidoacrylate peracid hydrolase